MRLSLARALDFTKVETCGREPHLDALRALVSEIQQEGSKPRFALVQGEIGSGKGVLCEKLQQKCEKDGVLCLRGAFEEGRANTEPFNAIMDSISVAYRELTSGASPEARAWKKTIDEGMGVHKTVLACLIPELIEDERAFDASSSVLIENVDRVVDASNYMRLVAAVKAFLRVLCAKQPVIWVLEDMQFATVCATIMIQTTLADDRLTRFGFIGTHTHVLEPNKGATAVVVCTNDEAGRIECKDLDDSMMTAFRDSLPSSRLTEVVLDPLHEPCIAQMLEQLVDSDDEQWSPLASVIERRTGGNFFFVKHAIAMLEKEKLIYFDTMAFRWKFDLEGAKEALKITSNMVDFVAEKMHKMPEDQQKALIHASSFGVMRFDLETVFRTFGENEFRSIDQLETALMTSVDEGLLEVMGGGKHFIFNHPRILESAYSLLSENERPMFHLKIGRNLLEMVANLPEKERHSRIGGKWKLHAVRQLGLGASVIPEEEKVWLAELNYEMARLSTSLGSFFPSMDYLASGLKLLDQDSPLVWKTHYDTILGLVTLMARMKFSVGMLDDADVLFDCIILRAANYHDKLPAYYLKVLSLTQKGYLNDAMELVLKVLSELKVNFPKKSNKIMLKRNMQRIERDLRSRSDQELARTTNKETGPVSDAIDFVVYLKELASLTGRSDYYKLAQIWMAQAAMDVGPAAMTRISFASWAMRFIRAGDLQQAGRFGNLSVEIGRLHENNEAHDVRATIMYICYCRHWKSSYQECCDLLVKQNELIVEKGFTEVLSLGILGYASFYFCSGMKLGPLELDLRRGYDTLNDYSFETDRDRLAPILQLVQNLQGKNENVRELTGDILDQETFWKQHSVVSKTSGRAEEEILQTFFLARLYLAFLFGDLDVAVEMIQKLENIKVLTNPCVWLIYQTFYQGMTSFAVARKTKSLITKTRFVREGLKCLKTFDGWVGQGAVNCFHMQLLLRAEHLAVTNTAVASVQTAYDKAIAAAGRLGFLNERALGNERAGLFFLEKRDERWAGIYLSEAHQLFAEWGATTKAQEIQQKAGWLLTASKSVQSGSFLKAKPRMLSLMEKLTDVTEDSLRSTDDTPAARTRPNALTQTLKGSSSRGSVRLSGRS